MKRIVNINMALRVGLADELAIFTMGTSDGSSGTSGHRRMARVSDASETVGTQIGRVDGA